LTAANRERHPLMKGGGGEADGTDGLYVLSRELLEGNLQVLSALLATNADVLRHLQVRCLPDDKPQMLLARYAFTISHALRVFFKRQAAVVGRTADSPLHSGGT